MCLSLLSVLSTLSVVQRCTDCTRESTTTAEDGVSCPCTCKFYQKTAEEYTAVCSCGSNARSSAACQSFECEPRWEVDYDYDVHEHAETRVGNGEETNADWQGSGEEPSIADTNSTETSGAGRSAEEPSDRSQQRATVRPETKGFSDEDATTQNVTASGIVRMDITERNLPLMEKSVLRAECSCNCLISANSERVSCDCSEPVCESWHCTVGQEEEELEGEGGKVGSLLWGC